MTETSCPQKKSRKLGWRNALKERDKFREGRRLAMLLRRCSSDVADATLVFDPIARLIRIADSHKPCFLDGFVFVQCICDSNKGGLIPETAIEKAHPEGLEPGLRITRNLLIRSFPRMIIYAICGGLSYVQYRRWVYFFQYILLFSYILSYMHIYAPGLDR